MHELPSSEADVVIPHSMWSDPETGVVEEATFLDQSGTRLLGFLHRPAAGPPTGGLLLCSSLYEDLELNNRAELLVARSLAAHGYAVVRFHYRSTGNSDDVRDGAVSLQSMIADARAAESWLVARTGVTRVFLCGFRLGALVAAELARRNERTPLILWAPTVNGAGYYRGMSRAGRVAGMRAPGRRQQAAERVEKQFVHQGAVEMLGHLVDRASYDDLRARALPEDLGRGRSVLLVELGLGDGNSQYEALVSRWTDGGAAVEVLRVRTRQLWLVPDVWEPEERSPTTQQIVEGITGWVARVAEHS